MREHKRRMARRVPICLSCCLPLTCACCETRTWRIQGDGLEVGWSFSPSKCLLLKGQE